MTAIEKTTEQLDLTGFEFDLPCGVSYRDGSHKCGQPATWWVKSRPHGCRTDQHAAENLLCDPHFRALMSGAFWTCTTCDEAVHARLFVIRTERIR